VRAPEKDAHQNKGGRESKKNKKQKREDRERSRGKRITDVSANSIAVRGSSVPRITRPKRAPNRKIAQRYMPPRRLPCCPGNPSTNPAAHERQKRAQRKGSASRLRSPCGNSNLKKKKSKSQKGDHYISSAAEWGGKCGWDGR